MNPQDNDKQDDSTSNGPDGQGDSVDERSENLGEESRSMNDEYEYAATGDAGTGRSAGRDEGPELTDLLRQATRLLRRQFVAAIADGDSETEVRRSANMSTRSSTTHFQTKSARP